MAERIFYVGSHGPYFYDDEDLISEPDYPEVDGRPRSALTARQIELIDAPTNAKQAIRQEDLAGGNVVDGDLLELSFIPTYYTRDSTGPDTDDVIQTGSHFKGIDNELGIQEGRLNTIETELSRINITLEGGIAIRLLNDTGSNSVKGSAVAASSSTDEAFILQSNEYDTIGFVYESGIADGQLCWVVISGVAEVLVEDSHSMIRGEIAIASTDDGRVTSINNPGSGLPAANTHFKEVGHVLESVTGGTNQLCKIIVHFN